jgi:hypothetical protein
MAVIFLGSLLDSLSLLGVGSNGVGELWVALKKPEGLRQLATAPVEQPARCDPQALRPFDLGTTEAINRVKEVGERHWERPYEVNFYLDNSIPEDYFLV